AMRRLEPGETLGPLMPAADALDRMAKGGASHLPVIDEGRLRGMLTRSKILHALETRRLM
ncbi:MAG: CBS domain-containing protein, partial [Elusimicrobia bacterium]|nr:CBS domain-containing protein [Elusimicrobiota bacterium]